MRIPTAGFLAVLAAVGTLVVARGQGLAGLGASSPAGFNPEPHSALPRELRESMGNSRLTVVFAPAHPGCSSALVPALQTLQRFEAAFPETRTWTALRPEIRLPEKYTLGRVVSLDPKDTVGFGGQEDGLVAAYDRAGRTLLFRIFTKSSVDGLYAELETAYSLTVPNSVRWVALDARR